MNTKALKSFLLVGCAVFAGALSHGADSPDTTYLARYDLELRDGDVKSTVKSQSFLDENSTTAFGYTPHFIELRLQPVSDSEYDVQLTVAPTRDARRGVRLDKTFRGRYGSPLELVADTKQLHLKGTLAILRSKQT